MLFVVTACSDPLDRYAAREDVIGIEAVVTAGTCDVAGDVTDHAKFFFKTPEKQAAGTLARDLGDACSNGDQPAVTALAWQILGMVEAVLESGNIGTLSRGIPLTTALLSCTTTLCLASAVPDLDLVPAFSAYGLFAVRSTDTEPAIARAAIPFTDLAGQANTALWGVEVDLPWSIVTAANPVLVYGGFVQNGLALDELSLGDIHYSLNVYPDAGEFLDGALHVGTCFTQLMDLPLVDGAETEPRIQREGVVLEDHTPGFCPSSSAPQSASIAAPFLAFARSIMPAPLRSLFVRATRVGVVGGTPLDFSTHAAIATTTDGTLEFVVPPNTNVVAGQSIGEIQVRARSGAGTPMERVLVTLYILNNSGAPAGAVLSGDIASYTQERDGVEGIATFPDNGDPVSVGKAGGYRICAAGQQVGFSFADICSDLIIASNAK
jgi:hypothetical protein